jgi:hypothetical protein
VIVEQRNTYRLDLRDYDWDRAVTVSGVEYADGWEALVAQTPHALTLQGATAERLREQTGAPYDFRNPLGILDAAAELFVSRKTCADA